MRPDAILETTVPTSWRNPSVQIIRRARGITVLESSCVSHALISHIPTYILHISYLISHILISHISGRRGCMLCHQQISAKPCFNPLCRTIFDLLTMRCFSNLFMRLIARIRLHRSTTNTLKYMQIDTSTHKPI